MPFKMHKIVFFSKKKNVSLPFLTFTDLLPETHKFFIWPYSQFIFSFTLIFSILSELPSEYQTDPDQAFIGVCVMSPFKVHITIQIRTGLISFKLFAKVISRWHKSPLFGKEQGTKFHSSARNYEWNLENTSLSSQSTRPVRWVLWEELLEEVILHFTPLCSLLHTLLKVKCMCLQDEWKL